MRIDGYGCVVMEKDGPPGDLGDSCAETGRYMVLLGMMYNAKLMPFLTDAGFLRHPDAPWREEDFTSDQALYLLMAADLTSAGLFLTIVNKIKALGWRTAPAKIASPDVIALCTRSYQTLAALNVAQMLINKFPWRWDDSNQTATKWWRFVRSEGSTVSFMTVFVAMVFLKRKGITWPQKFWNKETYLAKAKSYYENQPRSLWFTELYDRAPL